MSIQVLDKKTIDQIAAGEVVERPSSVVKELVENALDAGSTAVTVEIRDGGMSLIRVTDDGCGIDADDIPRAFLRHATSKIRLIDDLDHLTSLGFRGEALSSIAAVSRVELITKPADALMASRYRIDGGQEIAFDEIGAPDGTTILVRDLFYNVPARAKFLKTTLTESTYVGTYVEQLALSHPDVAFTYIVSGSTRISTSGNGSLKDVIYHLYGREVVKELLSVEKVLPESGLTITGFIAKPVISRGNRAFENYYVNGRYVRNRTVMKAIEDGFGNRLMQHQYPFTCLFIEIDGTHVDVNVHPTKMEVRFFDEPLLYETLRSLIRDTLSASEMIVEAAVEEKKPEKAPVYPRSPEPFEKKLREGSAGTVSSVREISGYGSGRSGQAGAGNTGRDIPGSAGSDTKLFPEPAGSDTELSPGPGGRDTVPSSALSEAPASGQVYEQASFGFLTEKARTEHKLIGQAFGTYWLVEYQNSLFIIDQHAAHEKVLYEHLIRRYLERDLASQAIDPPLIVSLSLKEEALLNEHLTAFEGLGFEIEPFGERDYAIRAVPYTLSALGSKELFHELLDHLEDTDKVEELDLYTHRVATEACKAAVKGHDVLSFQEADRLIDDLLKLDDPYHCPHGRPTIIAFSAYDLEKKFRRIV